ITLAGAAMWAYSYATQAAAVANVELAEAEEAAAAAGAATPWGLIVAGVGLAIGAYNALKGASESVTDVIEKNAKGLESLSSAKAATEFDNLVKKLHDTENITGETTSRLEAFQAIAKGDPAAAALIVQGMEQRGQATGKYRDILDHAASKQRETTEAE